MSQKASADVRYCFRTLHHDATASLRKEFLMCYYPSDNGVELTDIGARRSVLKRTPCPGLRQESLFIGASIVVFGRVLELVAYGDGVTKQLCEGTGEAIVVAVPESMFRELGNILLAVEIECEFRVRDLAVVQSNSVDCAALGMPPAISTAKGRLCLLHLIRDNAAAKGASLVARFRGLWFTSDGQHVATLSTSFRSQRLEADAHGEIATSDTGPQQSDTTVVIIKPHVIAKKLGGEVLQRLLAPRGVALRGLMQVLMSPHSASDFMSAYNGVIEGLRDITDHMSSGPVWVCSLGGEQIVARVRELAGPYDPVIARALRADSLRALYGTDVVHNAVHVTDTIEDGPADHAFFFDA